MTCVPALILECLWDVLVTLMVFGLTLGSLGHLKLMLLITSRLTVLENV